MEINNNISRNSRKEFAPLSFWAWNSNMDKESINKRIKEFHEQGFRGFFMHSRGGLRTPYFSDDWFQACRYASEEAAKYDMEVWIYDEDGWPSGFAGGQVNGRGIDYQSKYFSFTKTKPNNEARVIGSYKICDDTYALTTFEQGELWAIYSIEENYVDLLSNKVVNAFIETTYERYKQELGDLFGNTIKGFFTDEPQYFRVGFPYSFELNNYFEQRNGYRIEKELYKLLPEFGNESSYKFRKDFWNTIEEMMRLNFSKKIFDWCEQNHLQFTGHYPGEDSLIAQIQSTAGVMPKYMYQHVPGIDHLGKRITSLLLVKQVTSVAKQMGRKKVLSETFGCAGWNISFQEMCYIWGWQASCGVNIPTLHIGAHSILGIRKRDYPAFYSYQEPWWDDFHHVAEWMSGLNYIMSRGQWIEKVLIINPIQSIYQVHGSTEKLSIAEQKIAASYRNLCDNLLDIQVGFDLGDELIIKEKGEIIKNQIRIGECLYEHIIVPECIELQNSTWELLNQFSKNGGKITYTNQIPIQDENREVQKDIPVIQNSKRFWYKYFKSINHSRAFTVYEKTGFEVADRLSVAIKEDEGKVRGYIWNLQKDSERELKLMAPGKKQIHVIHPETLEKSMWIPDSVSENITIYAFRLKGMQSLLIEISDEEFDFNKKDLETTNINYLKKRVSIEDLNTLTIDYAAYSFDSLEYSSLEPIVKLQKNIYKELNQNNSKFFYVKYKFLNRIVTNTTIYVAIEKSDKCIYLLCNGKKINDKKIGYYIDEDIVKYDISDFVLPGINEIEIKYENNQKEIQDVEGLFETETNRFFYPVEPEAIYILGKFEVDPQSKFEQKLNYIQLNEPRFALKDPLELKTSDDITKQGYWFYRGNVRINVNVNYDGSSKYFLEIEDVKGAYITIKTQKDKTVQYMEPFITEITELLHKGDNHICIIIHGTNRNIFGPHHHVKGENNFVGCNTFNGIRGYEDSIVNYELSENSTWTDAYAFVELGCGKIKLITKK
mgnify:CR=1 FL=1